MDVVIASMLQYLAHPAFDVDVLCLAIRSSVLHWSHLAAAPKARGRRDTAPRVERRHGRYQSAGATQSSGCARPRSGKDLRFLCGAWASHLETRRPSPARDIIAVPAGRPTYVARRL